MDANAAVFDALTGLSDDGDLGHRIPQELVYGISNACLPKSGAAGRSTISHAMMEEITLIK
jgi:hypothetical protein